MQLIDLVKHTKNVIPLRLIPKGHMWALSALFFVLIGISMLPSKQAMATRQIETISLPNIPATEAIRAKPEDVEPRQKVSALAQEDVLNSRYTTPQQPPSASPSPDSDDAFIVLRLHTETVKQGDSLSLIFKRAGIGYQQLHKIVNGNKNGKKLRSIFPGHTLEFSIDQDKQLQKLVYRQDKLHSFSFDLVDDRFVFSDGIRKPDVVNTSRGGTITDSLFMAGKAAKLDDRIMMELANIFGWDVDFALEVRKGDSFRVLFEELFLEGEKIGNGNILAAEFTNRDKTYRAVRYVNDKGDANYFTPEGDTLRKEFLRSPIDFARISSHFNLRRKHPVLNTIRAHKGTDYAAAHGTPIKATGDGKVTFAGRKGGYGNVVIVQHGQKYKTLYAHVSRYAKKVRVGARVKQGQTIAYVGATGLATGPHLHYEFYENGAVRNPTRVKLPKAKSISVAEATRFKAQTRSMLSEFWPADYPLQLVENTSSNNES